MQQVHQHDVVYFGVVNLVHDTYIIGAVDIWKCRSCSQLFCEDKRYGVTDLAPEVGLPKIEPDSKWATLICTRNNSSNWTLTQVRPGSMIAHSCTPETKLELQVGSDYDLHSGISGGIGTHRLIILENFVNSAVDVQSGQKHVTTTNAYQALGKPFSFTPPLSATVIQPSRYNVLNLASIVLLATAFFAAFLALTGQNFPGNLLVDYQALLGASAIGLGASAFFVSNRKSWGPLLALAVSGAALVIYSVVKLVTSNFGVTDLVLSGLLVVSLVVGWLARVRIKALIEKQWHPLDMPAYG